MIQGDLNIIKAIQFKTGLHVNLFLAPYDQIKNLVQKLITRKNTSLLNEVNQKPLESNTKFHHKITEPNKDAHIVRFVNDIIENAINKKVSDIHFEVYEHFCRVRFRQDGLLHEVTKPPKHIAKQLAARLKIIAKLDISKQQISQDGRCHIQLKNLPKVDIRVNSCPTLYG